MIEVVEPGVLTTVQDAGRPGWGHLGVPAGGAADRWALGVANVLAGNARDAAALEVTLAGARFRAAAGVTVAIAGADLLASAGGQRIAPGRSARLAAGEELAIPGPPARSGFRAYVAVAGGFDVPVVLGSRSTCLVAGFGGHEGRPLRAGDLLRPGAPAAPPIEAWPGDPIAPRMLDTSGAVVLRALAEAASGPLFDATWTVTAASDRMGVRLAPGDGMARFGAAHEGTATTETASHGVVRGTIQLPPDGNPIVLGADHQPTGGYRVAGVVVSADLPALGQLAPGDTVRFESVDRAAARSALALRREAWEAALQAIRGDARWDELWRSAGA